MPRDIVTKKKLKSTINDDDRKVYIRVLKTILNSRFTNIIKYSSNYSIEQSCDSCFDISKDEYKSLSKLFKDEK